MVRICQDAKILACDDDIKSTLNSRWHIFSINFKPKIKSDFLSLSYDIDGLNKRRKQIKDAKTSENITVVEGKKE